MMRKILGQCRGSCTLSMSLSQISTHTHRGTAEARTLFHFIFGDARLDQIKFNQDSDADSFVIGAQLLGPDVARAGSWL